MNLTIYGVRDRKKIIAVEEGATLARVRTLIDERWTREDLRRLLTLGGHEDLYARARNEPIPAFDFYTGSGEKLSFQDEQTRTAASFRNGGNRNQRLFLQPREAPSLSCELLRVFLLAVVGWTPPTWFNIQTLQTKTRSLFNRDDSLAKEERRTKLKEWLKALCIAIVFCLIFLVDFSDAVVDLAIFSRGLVEGTDARGTNYGILLGVMTILSRILLGWYGVAHAEIRSSAASHYYDDQELEHLAIAHTFLSN